MEYKKTGETYYIRMDRGDGSIRDAKGLAPDIKFCRMSTLILKK